VTITSFVGVSTRALGLEVGTETSRVVGFKIGAFVLNRDGSNEG
jgi:hypothetical protein